MTDSKNDILGLIPARGGSKSIPLKNIVTLDGDPLISYVIKAARKSRSISRLICSTDNEEIGGVAVEFGAEIMERPVALAKDETHVIDVMVHVIQTLEESEGYIPFAVALLQPTSPFVLPGHIDECVNLLNKDKDNASVQTTTMIPHNFHAYNQRVVENGHVRFRFPEERRICYNKQKKPQLFMFGNLVITRTESLLKTMDIFPQPSLAYEIPYPYALDVDSPEDLELAEWYIEKKKVWLPKFD
ncbi:MAG: acylneuraminate cytidylyltransferase family protein [Deltaproteobacteria bacterium]|nr:acylneuraminate cytidylyltransferase family protein [Deltaproteobacteria bacterium]